jgi:hypothetical protein
VDPPGQKCERFKVREEICVWSGLPYSLGSVIEFRAQPDEILLRTKGKKHLTSRLIGAWGEADVSNYLWKESVIPVPFKKE